MIYLKIKGLIGKNRIEKVIEDKQYLELAIIEDSQKSYLGKYAYLLMLVAFF
jgi:hypothetical protein